MTKTRRGAAEGRTAVAPAAPATRRMTPAASVYLDVWRTIAAFGVLLGHLGLPWISAAGRFFPDLGHEMVIVFFFLSGFVIADATLGRRREAMDYAAARLARMYSVVLPALALTALAIVVVARLAPDIAGAVLHGHEVARLALTAAFLQETWFISASPATNAPLWSLGYELWYYGLFGIWIYARSRRWRWGLTLAVVAIVGPKVLLLLPVWLTGVAVWWWHVRLGPLFRSARLVAVVAGALLLALVSGGWSFPGGRLAVAPWFYSGRWGSDLLLGVLFGAHVLGCGGWWGAARAPAAVERPVRALAGMTFSLYAYHYPLLLIGASLPFYDPHDRGHVVMLAIGVVAVVIVMHRFTEARRRWWHDRFIRWLARGRREVPAVVSGETRA